jgi:hypothetical protein
MEADGAGGGGDGDQPALGLPKPPFLKASSMEEMEEKRGERKKKCQLGSRQWPREIPIGQKSGKRQI